MESNYVELDPVAMFADRDTIKEAHDYAELIAKSSESYIHAIAPWYVLYNTIANNYYLVPKDKSNEQAND